MTDKAYLDHNDIAERYGCSNGFAYRIIRSIKQVNSGSPLGGALGKGKVLPSEVEYWEQNRGRIEAANVKGAIRNEEAAV